VRTGRRIPLLCGVFTSCFGRPFWTVPRGAVQTTPDLLYSPRPSYCAVRVGKQGDVSGLHAFAKGARLRATLVAAHGLGEADSLSCSTSSVGRTTGATGASLATSHITRRAVLAPHLGELLTSGLPTWAWPSALVTNTKRHAVVGARSCATSAVTVAHQRGDSGPPALSANLGAVRAWKPHRLRGNPCGRESMNVSHPVGDDGIRRLGKPA
jgi:hypothetical protein